MEWTRKESARLKGVYWELSRELQQVLETFSPEIDAWASIRLDPATDDLSRLPAHPQITKAADQPFGVHVLRKAPFNVYCAFEIRISWELYDDGELVGLHCCPTKILTIHLGGLRNHSFSIDSCDQLGVFPYKIGEISDWREHEKGKYYGTEEMETLIEVGRVLAKKLNLNVEIPDLRQGRSR